MFDWYAIKYLFPNAFAKFAEVMFPNVGIESISTLEYFDIKKLYHFFDKEGVYLTVEMYTKNDWDFCITMYNNINFSSSKERKRTREEIEYDGFTECFRFLEKKIKES